MTSTGFFFALIIFYTFANLGVLSLRSHVNIAGIEIYIFCNPKSTSLVTVAFFSPISITLEKVAHGIPSIDARICPV